MAPGFTDVAVRSLFVKVAEVAKALDLASLVFSDGGSHRYGSSRVCVAEVRARVALY